MRFHLIASCCSAGTSPVKGSLTLMNADPSEALDVRDVSLVGDRRRVLNAGAGPRSQNSLHAIFKNADWREVRLDINPATAPDVVASITNMRAFFSEASFDAVWSSHSLEHLHAHEVPSALTELRHVLKADGFALITCPDLEAVAAALIDHGPDHGAYVSAIGPITPLDMLFGHSASVGREIAIWCTRPASRPRGSDRCCSMQALRPC
jgi:SAM-dependent methyltransferase